MTPEEARSIRCCGPSPENTGIPADVALPEGGTVEVRVCSANACAGWRWKEEKRTEAFSRAVVDEMKASGKGYNAAVQVVILRRSEFKHIDGFCGYAGVVEGVAP